MNNNCKKLDYFFNKTSDISKTLPDDICNEYFRYGFDNRSLLEKYELCGCFFCEEIFNTDMINIYIGIDENTSICPFCNVDSLIPVNKDEYMEYKELLSRLHNKKYPYIINGEIILVLDLGQSVIFVSIFRNDLYYPRLLTSYSISPSIRNKLL